MCVCVCVCVCVCGDGRTYVDLLLAGEVHHQAHGQRVLVELGHGQLGTAGVLQDPQLPLVLYGESASGKPRLK